MDAAAGVAVAVSSELASSDDNGKLRLRAPHSPPAASGEREFFGDIGVLIGIITGV